jgi:hypothetical protein
MSRMEVAFESALSAFETFYRLFDDENYFYIPRLVRVNFYFPFA